MIGLWKLFFFFFSSFEKTLFLLVYLLNLLKYLFLFSIAIKGISKVVVTFLEKIIGNYHIKHVFQPYYSSFRFESSNLIEFIA
ncbi:hypothetical protein RIR_jg33671.t1 [Rhizophagus irregularis DAOM 181602=DAOM 197198]|nr:hypothetical protein RIR_jg33671.t1 [Rhizophagus irregularis DAOM 181602=DAOM 197198]